MTLPVTFPPALHIGLKRIPVLKAADLAVITKLRPLQSAASLFGRPTFSIPLPAKASGGQRHYGRSRTIPSRNWTSRAPIPSIFLKSLLRLQALEEPSTPMEATIFLPHRLRTWEYKGRSKVYRMDVPALLNGPHHVLTGLLAKPFHLADHLGVIGQMVNIRKLREESLVHKFSCLDGSRQYPYGLLTNRVNFFTCFALQSGVGAVERPGQTPWADAYFPSAPAYRALIGNFNLSLGFRDRNAFGNKSCLPLSPQAYRSFQFPAAPFH